VVGGVIVVAVCGRSGVRHQMAPMR
jgi:hypothetical protein